MLESPHEILLIHSSEGRLQRAVLGNRDSVFIPPDLPEGAILSHNHPSGRGPSDSDLKAVLSRPGIRIRVVSASQSRVEVFDLLQTSEIIPEEIEQLVTLYKDLATKSGDTAQARRDALALISEEIGNMFVARSRFVQ